MNESGDENDRCKQNKDICVFITTNVDVHFVHPPLTSSNKTYKIGILLLELINKPTCKLVYDHPRGSYTNLFTNMLGS